MNKLLTLEMGKYQQAAKTTLTFSEGILGLERDRERFLSPSSLLLSITILVLPVLRKPVLQDGTSG